MKKIDNNENKSSLIIHNIEITNYKSNQMRPRSFFRSKSELDNSKPTENSQSTSRFLKYFTCCCSCGKFRKSSDSTSHQMYRTRVFSREVLKSHDEVEMVDKSIPTDLSVNRQEILPNSGNFSEVHQNITESEKDSDTIKNDQPQFTSEYIEYHNDSSQNGEINCNSNEVHFDSIVRSNSKTSSLIPMTGSDDPESSEINSSINDSEQYEDQTDDNNYNQTFDQNNDQDNYNPTFDQNNDQDNDQNQINDYESNQNLNQTPDEKYYVTDDKYKVIYGNLLVLRDVKIHDKLRVSSKGELSIDSSYIPSITRAITGNNKVVTVEQVEETVKTARKLKYMQTIRDCINDKLIQGIRNLAQTYENTEFKTKLESMAEDLNADRE